MGRRPGDPAAVWSITYPSTHPAGACAGSSPSSDYPPCLEITGPWWNGLNSPFTAAWLNQQTGGAFVAYEWQKTYPAFVPSALFGLYDPPQGLRSKYSVVLL